MLLIIHISTPKAGSNSLQVASTGPRRSDGESSEHE